MRNYIHNIIAELQSGTCAVLLMVMSLAPAFYRAFRETLFQGWRQYAGYPDARVWYAMNAAWLDRWRSLWSTGSMPRMKR